MITDPIVAEIRLIRDAIASEHNYDPDAIGRMLEHRMKLRLAGKAIRKRPADEDTSARTSTTDPDDDNRIHAPT
jgi:hypothetical protein